MDLVAGVPQRLDDAGPVGERLARCHPDDGP
jgi:hypothetical protein